MKKIFLLLIIIACIVHNANAQGKGRDLRSRLLFGLKVGANISNVYDTKGENFRADPKAGLATGGFLAIPIGRYLGIQPEILFSQKGFQTSGINQGNNYYMSRTTSYLDIPLFVAFKPLSIMTLLAGPQYSYLLKRRDVFSNETMTVDQQNQFDNDNIRKNILCFVGGVDFNLRHVVLSARTGWDVQRNNGDGTSTMPRYKNVWFQATVGYRFY
jgi:hypothetical protein